MIQSHWTGTQGQPNLQTISFGSTINTNASSSYVNLDVWAPNNVQAFPIDANTLNTSYVSQWQSKHDIDMLVR